MKRFFFYFIFLFPFLLFNAQIEIGGGGHGGGSGSPTITKSLVYLNTNDEGNKAFGTLNDSADPAFNGANLGTFTKSDKLNFSGGQLTANLPTGYTVINTPQVRFTVYPTGQRPTSPSYTPFNLLPDNGLYQRTDGINNILSTLNDNGNYTLEVYYEYTATNGTSKTVTSDPYSATLTMNDSSLSVSDLNNTKKDFVSGGKLYTQQNGKIRLQVYDYSGRILKTLNENATGNPIDLGIQEKGQYILVVSDKTGKKEAVKFMK